MEECFNFIKAEQGRGIAGRSREVADQVDDGVDLFAVGPVLSPVAAAPRPLALAGTRMAGIRILPFSEAAITFTLIAVNHGMLV